MELERKKAFLIRAAYLAFWGAVLLWALRYLGVLLAPFVLGFLLAYILRPAANFINRHSGVKARSASILAAVAFYALLGILLWLAGTLLFVQLERLLQTLPELYGDVAAPALRQVNGWVQGVVGALSPGAGENAGRFLEAVEEGIQEAVANLSGWGMELAGGLLGAVPGFLLALIFTILSSVVISGDFGTVSGFVMRQIPARLHGTVLEVRDFLLGTLGKLLRAYLILSLITFGELLIGLWILGIPAFLGVAALTAVLDLLPLLGSGAVLIPWGIYRLIAGDYWSGIGLLVLWGAVALVRQLMEPRLVGGQLGLHPLATLVAMYCGLKLAGAAGLLAAPVLCLLARHLQEKGLIRLYR